MLQLDGHETIPRVRFVVLLEGSLRFLELTKLLR
jgi:hypothetical protein